MIKPSYFSKSFRDAFNDDLIFNRSFHMAKGSGKDYALDFYLKGDSLRKNTPNRPIRFKMGLSTNNSYLEMMSIGQGLKVGYHTTWKVQAMEIFPSEDLRSIPISRRKCRFEDEIEGQEIFQVYSQSACKFEFKIKKAKEFCQCLPWYIPFDSKSKKHIICDLYGNYCFKTMMKDQTRNINCLPSCHQIQYTYSEVIEKINKDGVCKIDFIKTTEKNLAEYLFFPDFINEYAIIKAWSNSEVKNDTTLTLDSKMALQEFCKTLVEQDLAKVTIFFEKKNYVRTLTNLRVTFTDKLGTFGNIIFISFISKYSLKFEIVISRWNSWIVHWNEYT